MSQIKKLRVLIFASAFVPKIDGVSLRCTHLLKNLNAMGYETILLCSYEGAPDFYDGTRIIKLPSFQPLNYSESRIAYPFPILTLLKSFFQFKPDIVHFIGPEFVYIPTAIVAKLLNIPVIGSYHFNVNAWLDSQDKWTRVTLHWMKYCQHIYNFSDYVITPSQPMKEILNSIGMKCNDVWPPAVNSETFNPKHGSRAMRELLTFGNPDAPIVIYVGRLAQEKSLELLDFIVRDHPTVYLAVIGGGPSADEWKVKHGAENRIFCLGEHWSGDKLSEAYASADIFVCPSKFETLGNVVLEAMASGVASVGCNAGGIPHMIKHGVTGLLFPEDDGPALSKAIGELIYNSEYRNQLAENGKKYAQSITWESSISYVTQIYDRVIKMRADGKYANYTDKYPVEEPKSSLMSPFIQNLCILLLVAWLVQYLLSLL